MDTPPMRRLILTSEEWLSPHELDKLSAEARRWLHEGGVLVLPPTVRPHPIPLGARPRPFGAVAAKAHRTR